MSNASMAGVGTKMGTARFRRLPKHRTVLLVRAQEERTMVWQGRREFDHLGFAFAQIHHGRVGGR